MTADEIAGYMAYGKLRRTRSHWPAVDLNLMFLIRLFNRAFDGPVSRHASRFHPFSPVSIITLNRFRTIDYTWIARIVREIRKIGNCATVVVEK